MGWSRRTLTADLRVATRTDAACIGVLASQVFVDTYAPAGIRPALAAEVLDHFSTNAVARLLDQPATIFIVAEIANHMVGFVQLTRGATHAAIGPGNAVELDRLYVLSRFNGRGIGTQLLQRAQAWSAAQGAATLWLTAWVGNHHALAYYARRGFEDIGATTYTFQGEDFENRVFVRAVAIEHLR